MEEKIISNFILGRRGYDSIVLVLGVFFRETVRFTFWRARTPFLYAFEPYRDQTTVISRRTVRARKRDVHYLGSALKYSCGV